MSSAARVAGVAFQSVGEVAVATGSFALALQTRFPFRIPNDLDFITHDENTMERLVRVLAGLSASPVQVRQIRLFDTTTSSVELTLQLKGGGVAIQDLLPCQISVRRSQSIVPVVRTRYGADSLFIEHLDYLLANKLHALWKARNPHRVSSRCRDLFDLELMFAKGMSVENFVHSAKIAFSLGMPRSGLGRVPREWLPVWHGLNSSIGQNLDIDTAWVHLHSIIETCVV